MKILMVIDTLRAGGKERRLLELVKGLKSKNVSCEVVVLSNLIEYEAYKHLSIPIYCIQRKIKWDPGVFGRLNGICKKFQPDLIHVWETMASFYITPIAKIQKIPVLSAIVADAPEKISPWSKKSLLANLSFLLSDKIIGNSEAGLQAYNVSSAKSLCIYNGIDLTRSEGMEEPNKIKKKLGIDKAHLVVGMVATFSHKKDYHTFINSALEILKKYPKTIFLCIGEGPELEKIKSSVPSHYAEKIRFLGRRSDVESLVSIFDIGVLATFTEGISNAIIEYMLMSKPVVATDGGGTKELVIDGITGYLVQKKSVTDLQKKIELLLSDESLRLTMGSKGKQRILDEFNLAKMTDNYLKLYNNIIYT